jgi:hypothetical protein
LHDHCALEYKQHAECEQAIVPVLIEKPESTAEYLEHEERSYKVLFVDIEELWNRDVNLVLSPY